MALQRFRCLAMGRHYSRTAAGHFLLKLGCAVACVFLFCEFLVYYTVIYQCRWPELKLPEHNERKPSTPSTALKAVFLADTHLLGRIKGHWFDKLRREWQMERSFQTALRLLEPEIVFILGDVFDEGKWSSAEAWTDDVRRFLKIFHHPKTTEVVVVVGNHDVGFHYEMNDYKLKRFGNVFNMTLAKIVTRKGINFVLVNSIALEGDGCPICKKEEKELIRLSFALNCSRQLVPNHVLDKECSRYEKFPSSSPILLQHYPLYRKSDSECSGEDAAPPEDRNMPFKEKYDVLSQEASRKLIWWFHPRLILSGHTHSACEVLHAGSIQETSVPSFSWRNRDNPSFIMGVITATDFTLGKCFLPRENTIITIYLVTAFLVFTTFLHFCLVLQPIHLEYHLINTHKVSKE
ncbi:metallophosphoesterase 1 [Protopterus annectens]|uniref:metallophosphoesterase 1 n=1 Tax=Protopterus annectens TaxID=7888 RepID=UPI001CFB95A4|nr:metallophosphoesterase 1 [Protopterus annectens]